MFGQKIKEAEHGLGTISDWAELHQSWISPGHWGCHWVHYCQGLTPPSQEKGQSIHSACLDVVTVQPSPVVCWFCIFAGEGSVKIISGLEARKYRERYTMVILNTHQHTSEVNIMENILRHILKISTLLFGMLSMEQWMFSTIKTGGAKYVRCYEWRNGLKNIPTNI